MDIESPASQNTPIVGFNDSAEHGTKRTKLVILGCIVLVVLIAAVVIALRILKTNEAATTISKVTASTNIAPTGLNPTTLQVKKGQPVTITNQDVRPHRLTADQDSLPGFDTVDMLNQGDSYTYIFETSGTFHYYDPADPKVYVGTVTVE